MNIPGKGNILPSSLKKRDEKLERSVKKIVIVGLMGFSSGLPLALTGGTLQAWMAESGIDIRTIGLFSGVALPYSLKFLWSPIMDRFKLPFLGRRRGWILLTQFLLFAGILSIAILSPLKIPILLGTIALFISFSSASQDIVVDAYRTDILNEKERGIGAGTFVTGYRIAMLTSGAGALIMAEKIGWEKTYTIMAYLILLCVVWTLLADEAKGEIRPPKTLDEAVKLPIIDFFSRRKPFLFLLLIILYKLADAYAGALTTAFLIKGVGFSPSDVGTINKGIGLFSLIIGAMVGGSIISKLGLFNSLLLFGVLQGLSNLSFTLLAIYGKSYILFAFSVIFENLSGGMGTSAFIALLMGMCNKNYSATQYALLSSIASVGRTIISPTSGFLAESVGWVIFFPITALFAIPGILLLFPIKKEIESLK